MKNIFKTLFLLGLLMWLPAQSMAFQSATAEELNVTEKVEEDLYAAGASVQLLSDIDGDLNLLAGEVNIDSNISKDAIILAGEARLDGRIDDDLHIAAGSIYMDSQVNGDAMVATGLFEMNRSSIISGDLLIASGVVRLNGKILGEVRGAADKVYINNTIEGDLHLYEVGEITFGPKGKVEGNLTYTANKKSTITPNKVDGKIEYKSQTIPLNKENSKTIIKGLVAAFSIFNLLALLILGALSLAGFKYYLTNATRIAYDQTLASFGSGLLVLVITPIFASILLATGIGYLAGIVLFLVWIMALIFAGLLGSIIIGFKLIKPNKKMTYGRLYTGFAVGAVIYSLFIMVPYIGWGIQFLFACIGLGSISIYEMELGKLLRKKKLI